MNKIFDLPPEFPKNTYVAIDTEIFGMNGKQLHRPTSGRLACMTICADPETVYIIEDHKLVQQALDRIKECIWIFHNAKFDLVQLRRLAFIPPRNKIIDTMLMEKILWSGYYDLFSLDDLARRYLDLYVDKTLQKSFIDATVMTDEMYEYAANDASVTLQIWNEQKKHISKSDMKIWKEIDMPCLWAILDFQGFRLDIEKWEKLAIQNRFRHEEIDGLLPFNPRSNPQSVKFYKENGFMGIPNNQKETVEFYIETYPNSVAADYARLALESKNCSLLASRYGMSFITDYLEKESDDVYFVQCDYSVIGAECLASGELVLTSQGYLPIENVKSGCYVITHKGNIKSVVSTTNNGIKPIYKITLSNGLCLRATDNHPYYMKNGTWKLAKELSIGDNVVIHSNAEEWKPVQDWDSYEISSWGRVRNVKTTNILSLKPTDKYGHLAVTLVRNGSQQRGTDRKDFKVHRLVALAFINNPDPKKNTEIRHLNGIAWDNTVNNLAWGTRQDNINDAINHGTMSHINSTQAKLNYDIASYIRSLPYERGMDKKLAIEYNVSRETIRDIRKNKKWKDKYLDGKKKEVHFDTAYVVSIEIQSPEMTYGLEVEQDHSHVTGGIVTHNTGRMSASSPAMHQIPSRDTKEYRKCFIARPNHKLIIADYSQQEVFIMAYRANDKAMMEICNSGQDIYVQMAKIMYKKDIEKSDPLRRLMKDLVLGTDYGMSEFGLSKKANISKEEAIDILNTFYKKFPNVYKYIESMKQSKKYVTTLSGRKIWLNPYSSQSERNALNAPIQGTASDMLKLAIVRLHKEWDFPCPFGIVEVTHDEIGLDVPEELANDVAKFTEKIMVEVANELCPGMKFRADAFIGNSWADKE